MFSRVVYITMFRPGVGGGDGVVAHEMAHHFAGHYNVGLICPGDRTEINQAENGLRIFTIESRGEGVLTLPILSHRNLRQLFAFLDEFNPDIIHAHDPLLVGVIGQVWAKMRRVPFILTSHVLPWKILEFGTSEALKIPARALTEPLVEEFFTHFYQNCDAVILMNETAAAGVREHHFNDRVFTIPNARHLDHFRACRFADTSAGEKILTVIGHISRRKNQRYLLEVLKELPENFRLQIIGEVLNQTIEQELRTFIDRNQLARVTFTGHVAQADIPACLEKTHALVSASTMEVQSLVVLEALASGTPVIGLSNETIDELVDESVGACLPREAPPEDFARAVARICTLPLPEYERLCRNARQRVGAFNWDRVMDLTIQAYEALLQDRPPVTKPDGVRLAKLIEFLPPGPARQALLDRSLSFASQVGRVQRVPGGTWLFAGLNVLTSLIARPLIRPPAPPDRRIARPSILPKP
jgi:glycosyltransferase involved in cell wall biosynthesis